mgnify:CR=1 FL=1
MIINTNNLSFWESDSFLNYDVIIVGAGISGLSTAISLVEKNNNVRVLILEKSIFPSGASTKNAGFACFGSLSELLSDMDTMGPEKCLELVQKRWSGLQKLRIRLSDDELGYEPLGGYELFKPSQTNYLSRLEEVNTLLKPIFNADVFVDVSKQIEGKGFNTHVFQQMVFNPFEGQIHTGKTMHSLWQKASQLGVKIITGAVVKSVKQKIVQVEISTGRISFIGKKIIVTTNAFTKSLYPDLELKPGRGQVLITQPIQGLRCKGTFHMDEGYFYFRNVGNRLLLGGGRNLDFKGEETTLNGINTTIDKALREILKNEILPHDTFVIEQQWSGIMAFGEEKSPILKWIDPNTLLAVRLGGMGMAIGTELGDLASDLVLNNWKEEDDGK